MTKQEKSSEEVRSIIVSHRCVASRGVNTESILMSWKVGSYISARLESSKYRVPQFCRWNLQNCRLNLQKLSSSKLHN